MTITQAQERDLQRRVRTLQRFYPRIEGCQVRIVVPQRHRRSDTSRYTVGVDLALPGGHRTVTRQPDRLLRRAVSDAFAAARRELQDYARRQRGSVKRHQPAPVATVREIYPLAGYGFLETDDGRAVYFDRQAVTRGGFARLAVGTAVRYSEEAGDRGPQASTVTASAPRRHKR